MVQPHLGQGAFFESFRHVQTGVCFAFLVSAFVVIVCNAFYILNHSDLCLFLLHSTLPCMYSILYSTRMPGLQHRFCKSLSVEYEFPLLSLSLALYCWWENRKIIQWHGTNVPSTCPCLPLTQKRRKTMETDHQNYYKKK